MEDQQIGFGDNVRIRNSEETKAAGIAGLIGQVYGETTPSVTGVEVIGEVKGDYAINVFFEALDKSMWFASDLLEFIDHGAGTEIILNGVDKKWLRTATGEWVESPSEEQYHSFWERVTSRVFKRKE